MKKIIRIGWGLGLVLSLHLVACQRDEVATNHLTIDATDPKSGTAEFKAAAVRLEAVEG